MREIDKTYHQFITTEAICPTCGKSAMQRIFDVISSGSVNSHYSIHCSHCNHHECDREDCDECNFDSSNNAFIMIDMADQDAAGAILIGMDELIFQLKNTLRMDPVLWGTLKLELVNHPDAIYYMNYGRTPRESYLLMQRELLDFRFTTALNRRIEDLKQEAV
jgi:hypothetical protein